MTLKKLYPAAALAAMITGGGVTISLIISKAVLPYGLDANIFGLSCALLAYIIVHQLSRKKGRRVKREIFILNRELGGTR